ncbi:MAG: TPR repeat containing exported protein; Putative periplasmic protein contains a protein prenylyltransferase domain [uncultured Sulfurovum sp.]|uniref:TPR repeat containing exported protein Putative periplasmic protein contains a protein prenylyltransferase domain n=1 Tax=uncultured Sulfurovum sp. TaxID=269237 RepID=A0A6S6SDQ9_9BACT|nr:MAG: TPR repeat containing exported protein; Putative periplasmic protein contains a protein prenylyltransferase domain [uncultured Sulfurovum sp.]
MLNKNKIIFVGSMAMASLLYANEPSVYGAGDINSASPYGLTKTEQAVLENKKTLQMLYNTMTEQQRKIDGLTTVIEGQNREILELKEQLVATQQIQTTSARDENSTYSILLELGQTVDQINNTYVSRDELKKVLAGSRPDSDIGSPIESNSADIYRKGVQLFGKRSYEAAKVYFEQTVAVNYKTAPSNYYLGEIAYYTHNYKDAVGYYKLSAALYDQASYMDVLFLHTAIALDKTGEKAQAQSFYQHVIDTYPNKKSASIAKNRM